MRVAALLAAALAVATGCVEPSDRRPGLALSGESVDSLPADWAFTDEFREIALEVRTPYWLPHSVTIWCAALDGTLYVGAREPDTKRWPGWVDRDPDVRMKIGSRVYEARLTAVDQPDRIAAIQRAYAAKYQLPVPSGDSPPFRYWVVAPREG